MAEEKDELVILHMNVGQYGLSKDLLEEIFTKEAVKNADIIILSEVKLSLGDSSFDRGVQGWSREEHFRKDQQHGGLLFYVKNNRGMVHYKWDGLEFGGSIEINAERGWIMVESNGEKIAVAGVYGRICDPTKKYHDNNVQLYDHLTLEAIHLLQSGYKLVTAGDFNAWLGSDPDYGVPGDVHLVENTNGVLLKNHLRTTGLKVVNRMDCCIGGPSTYMDRMGRQSLLDLFNISDGVNVSEMVIDDVLRDELDIDHVPIRITIKLKGVKEEKVRTHEQRGWFVAKDADWDVFKKVLAREDWKLEDVDVNVINDRLCKLLVNTAFSTNVYKKVKQESDKPKRRTLPGKVLQKIQRRREKFAYLRDLQKRGANDEDIENAQREARQAEQEEMNSFNIMRSGRFLRIRNLCNKGDRAGSSAFWKCVRGVEHGSDPIDVVKTKEGLRTADSEDIKATAEEHFANVFNAKLDTNDVTRDFESLIMDKTKEPKAKLSKKSKESLSDDFTYEELKKAINEAKLEKSAGLDKVKNELLKNMPESVERQVLMLFNKVKREKKTPLAWRKGRVRLLHKGKDKTDLGNYRPITLCSCLSKLFTKMLNVRLTKVVEDDGLLPREQVGFR